MCQNAPSEGSMKRVIAFAIKNGFIEAIGRGPAIKYKLTPQALVKMPLNLDT